VSRNRRDGGTYSVVRCAVDVQLIQPALLNEGRVVDKDGPELDENKEGDVEALVHGADKGEDVIWKGLGEAVDGVEGECGPGSSDDPFVVGLEVSGGPSKASQQAGDEVHVAKHGSEAKETAAHLVDILVH
jgi:hypothetical protein